MAKKHVFLLLCYCAALAFLILNIGDRGVIIDFVRPFMFALTSTAGIVFLAAAHRRHMACVSAALLSVFTAACLIVYRYYQNIGNGFSSSDVYAILQSDFAESKHYALDNFMDGKSLLLGLMAFLVSLGFMLAFMKGFVPFLERMQKKHLLSMTAVVFITSLVILYFTRPVHVFINSYGRYYKDIEQFNRLFNDISSAPLVEVSKEEEGELYVLVIGESESRDYMHVYGGEVENTPWRDSLRSEKNWVVFNHAYSHHTHTAPVLTAAFTEGRALTGLHFPQGQNLIHIAKQIGMHTVWISNQASLGAWDNPVSALASTANKTIFSKTMDGMNLASPEPDEVLLPILDEELRNIDFQKNNFIVIHLMGSHSPYVKRYPANYPYVVSYGPRQNSRHAFVSKKQKRVYEMYNTSIRYTDDVLREIAARITAHNDKPAIMLYFADHGEDVFIPVTGHNYSSFTWSMARIPLMLWASEAYQTLYPQKLKTLAEHADKVFTNDLIFDLFLGIANIKTPLYKPEFDISNALYALNIHNAIIADNKAVSADVYGQTKAD